MVLLRGLFTRVCVLAAVAVACCAVPSHALAAPARTIVLVQTDDQRWDTLWAMPNVNTLIGDEGVRFANAFVVNPLCCPSRATTLTGQYSHSTGVYQNESPFGAFGNFDDSSTVATWLDAGGYTTGYVGRYFNGYRGGRLEYRPPGWDFWTAYELGYHDYVLNENGVLTYYGSGDAAYSTDVLASRAVSLIEETDVDAPLFLQFAPFAPHSPPTSPTRHAGVYSDFSPSLPPSFDEENVADKPAWVQRLRRTTAESRLRLTAFRQRQVRSLLAVDEAVGRIVDALEAAGRLSDALILFTSDNGLFWGEHRMIDKKNAPYEEAIRVPLVVRYDPLVATPTVDPRLALNLDLAPTIAAAAGVDAPSAEGESLLPLLSGANVDWRDDFLIEHARGRGSFVPTYCAVRSDRFKYVSYETREEEFYDLLSDPHELTNVVRRRAYAGAVAAARARMEELCQPRPPILCTKEGSGLRDLMYGTVNYDVLCSYGGPDTVYGNAANDRIRSGAGDDRVFGEEGHDTLGAGDGADVVVGGTGRDTVYAGDGSDVLRARDDWVDVVDCGRGRDRAVVDALDAVLGCEVVQRPRRSPSSSAYARA